MPSFCPSILPLSTGAVAAPCGGTCDAVRMGEHDTQIPLRHVSPARAQKRTLNIVHDRAVVAQKLALAIALADCFAIAE
jgi:hypothetical protein